ncbi:MAG: sulfate ABC transporter substrate-binding protein [Acidobacteriota bacterium]
MAERVASGGGSGAFPRWVLWLLFLSVGGGGCGGTDEKPGVILTLAAYTTPREVYSQYLLPRFQEFWRQETGEMVRFQESYAGSGAQSRAVVGGFEADVVALSLAPDVDRIARAGLITHDWRSRPYGGIVTRSIVVMAVREGNPLGIRDWHDLVRPGLRILTPDPRTSGGAMWNLCAVYGAALRGKVEGVRGDEASAADFLRRVLANVLVMDKGARESITNFERGIGDVALTYENEVLAARRAGRPMDYVVPRSTILIENPVAVVDAYVDRHGSRAAAEAFLEFLWRPENQLAFAEHGFRPVEPTVADQVVARFPVPEDLWTIEALGGWDRVIQEIFGPEGLYPRLREELATSP